MRGLLRSLRGRSGKVGAGRDACRRGEAPSGRAPGAGRFRGDGLANRRSPVSENPFQQAEAFEKPLLSKAVVDSGIMFAKNPSCTCFILGSGKSHCRCSISIVKAISTQAFYENKLLAACVLSCLEDRYVFHDSSVKTRCVKKILFLRTLQILALMWPYSHHVLLSCMQACDES